MTSRIDTSRHHTKHVCPDCETNRTGLWATSDVLAGHDTDEITPAVHADIVAICVARGTVRGLRDVAQR